jgi:hypothetical protein
MKMITNTFVTADGKYHVESFGNGWAYGVTDQRTGESFFVQDSSADELARDSDYFENTNVLGDYMEALGQEA